MKRFLAFCFLTLAFVSPARADLSSLAVQFTPNATQYTKGEVVSVTATSNGTNAQYRFILDKVDVGVVAVSSSSWAANNSYQIDTFAVNMPAGKYRLRVFVRESANKPEILNKYEFFTVVAPAVVACDLIDGKTYTNAAAAPLSLGSLTLAQMLAGVSLSMSTGAAGITSVSFDAGTFNVAVQPASFQICTFFCTNYQTPAAEISGTYTCSDHTVTVAATGVYDYTNSPTLLSLLGASSPLSVAGNMLIDTVTDSLTAGGKTFE